MFEVTAPPRLHIQPLPKDAQLISLCVDTNHKPAIRIDVWMRNDWAVGSACETSSRSRSADDFIEDHCSSCEYYFDRRTYRRNNSDHLLSALDYSVELDDIEIDNDNVLTIELRSPCPTYRNGLTSDDTCLANISLVDYFDEEDTTSNHQSLNLDYLRFTVTLEPDTLKPYIFRSGYHYTGFKAAMQLVQPDEYDVEWLASAPLRVANTFGGDANNEICWGYGTTYPVNLADCAKTYATIPANDDLLTVYDHRENHASLARLDLDELKHPLPDTLFGNPSGAQCALLLAPATPAAFEAFMLLGSSSKAHLIQHQGMTPVVALFALWQEDVLLPDGQQISCYVSEAFPDSTCWLALPDPDDRGGLNGQLIGQLAIPKPQPTPAYA